MERKIRVLILCIHIPTSVTDYINDKWDYVITVCGGANETCPAFTGEVGKKIAYRI